MTGEEITLIENRLKEGYYSIDAISLRSEEAKQAAKNAKIIKVQSDFLSEKTKLENKLRVTMFLLENDFSIDNFIYYDHSNEGVFNWKNYGDQFSKEDFDRLMSMDLSELPNGFVFKIK